MIDKYRHVPYVSGGRTMDGLDCWGLVRLAREEISGQTLPEFGGVVDRRRMTKLAPSVKHELRPCDARHGAIAFAYRGKICIHVGIVVNVDNRMFVLETDDPSGVCLTGVSRFVSKFLRVEFYD